MHKVGKGLTELQSSHILRGIIQSGFDVALNLAFEARTKGVNMQPHTACMRNQKHIGRPTVLASIREVP